MKNTRKENKEMNKKEQAMLSIAREIVFSEAGERIPSIIEYSQKYNISVGLIQKALMSLQEEGALEIERRGVLGSYIKKINNEILMEKSVFGSLVGVMPLPYSKRYEGLATGIKNNFENYKFTYNLESVDAIKSCIINGYGMAFLPYSTIKKELYHKEVKIVDVEQVSITQNISMIKRNSHTGGVKRVISYMEKYIKKIIC